MINIVVFSNKSVDIEGKNYSIDTEKEMIIFIKDLIHKIKYSGETLNLESASINSERGIVLYHQIERW